MRGTLPATSVGALARNTSEARDSLARRSQDFGGFTMRTLGSVLAVFAVLGGNVGAQEPLRITVQTGRVRQAFDGLGAGVIFYEGHVTSLAARDRHERQQQLYDDMFARVPFVSQPDRETHEPRTTTTAVHTRIRRKNFEYCKHDPDRWPR